MYFLSLYYPLSPSSILSPPSTATSFPSRLSSVKDFDKPQEVLLRHHASISELKRNFMEAVPDHKPSEWDKRLSTHSPFRTLGINGQPLPSADGVSLAQKTTDPFSSFSLSVEEFERKNSKKITSNLAN